jgi:apolipoprotein N-acyltransferase
MRTWLHSAPSRLVLAALVAVSRLNLAGMLVLQLTRDDPPITPPVLIRTFLYFTVVPAGAAWLLERLLAAAVEVRDGVLVLTRRDLRLEVPPGTVAGVRPWLVALPRTGLTLRLRSGRRVRLATADPEPVLRLLAESGVEPARHAGGFRRVAYAHAAARPRARLDHPAAKFVVFALAPTAVAFSLEQHISYGGLLGQYYLEGFWPWLQTFLLLWGAVGIDCLLYAAVWRVAGEAIALGVTLCLPGHAGGVRRTVEIACRVAFYVGIPALVTMRLLA